MFTLHSSTKAKTLKKGLAVTIYDHLIIGAGIAGLSAARHLKAKGRTILLVEKGRGVGGRVATRRFDFREGLADHGAIAIDRNETEVSASWADIFPQLTLRPAPAQLKPTMEIIPSGMNTLPKILAHGLPIVSSQTVTSIHHEAGLWCCETQDGRQERSQSLIVTAPLPQTANLLLRHPELALEISNVANRVRYRPLWTVLITQQRPKSRSKPLEAYCELQHPIIHSLCEQGAKGLHQSDGITVLHTTEAFSRAQIEASPAEIESRVRHALVELAWDLSDTTLTAHRWRYAFVDNPLAQRIWTSPWWPGLVLAGDFALGSTIMNAALSGLAAAESALLLASEWNTAAQLEGKH